MMVRKMTASLNKIFNNSSIISVYMEYLTYHRGEISGNNISLIIKKTGNNINISGTINLKIVKKTHLILIPWIKRPEGTENKS